MSSRSTQRALAAVPVATIELAGTHLIADPGGALWWPHERLVAVADLHLEKGAAFAARGTMLPPYDTRDTLARLGALLDRLRPRTVVALGDSFHDVAGSQRLGAEDRLQLAALQRRRQWVWIAGNHDPAIDARLEGERAEALTIGPLTLRHEPAEGCEPQVVGHLHPVARVAANGQAVRRRCFAHDTRRLVLPAFGAFAGGLNVLDAAFDGVLDRDRLTVLAIGDNGVYRISPSALRPD